LIALITLLPYLKDSSADLGLVLSNVEGMTIVGQR
jgi:hypothetical protein